MRLLALLLCALLAGCAATPAPAADPAFRLDELRVGDVLLHNGGVRAGLSLLHVGEGAATTLGFPPGVLVLGADGRLAPPEGPVTVQRGEVVEYLPPYGAREITVDVGGTAIVVPLAPGRPFVDGDAVIDLLKVQRERFPNRSPGLESYANAVVYFEEFFEELGYEVETLRAPGLPASMPPVGRIHPEAITSVIAYKRGTLSPERYLVFGGHFDVVPETTEGALDNTGGTMSVLALAQAFARVNTSHTLVFAAWGGEESGILGSQAWLTAHPELVPFIDLYLNYDVSGLAWPAPAPDPANLLATTGPDGPLGDAVARHHAAVVADWMQLDLPVTYEPVAQGQATGGVNAQSDHSPFMARGIPVLFQYTSRIDDVRPLIHSELDTLDNLAAYALQGPTGVGAALSEAERAEGETVLARSYEVQMAIGFYLAVLTDAGVLEPARPRASFPLLENARS